MMKKIPDLKKPMLVEKSSKFIRRLRIFKGKLPC